MPDSSVPRLGSVADLIKYGARNTDRGHDIFERWELPDDDLIAQNAAKRLARLWRRWSYKQKEELLLAVEGIVSAESAKQAWNPGVRKRHQGLSQSAVAAARHDAAGQPPSGSSVFEHVPGPAGVFEIKIAAQ